MPAPSPTYDVVLANITAQSLITLSPRLPAVLAPRGRLLACGIIDAKADETLAAFEAEGLNLLDRKEAGDWVLLAMSARLTRLSVRCRIMADSKTWGSAIRGTHPKLAN